MKEKRCLVVFHTTDIKAFQKKYSDLNYNYPYCWVIERNSFLGFITSLLIRFFYKEEEKGVLKNERK